MKKPGPLNREGQQLREVLTRVTEACPFCDGAACTVDYCPSHQRYRITVWHAKGCPSITSAFHRRECGEFLTVLLGWNGFPVGDYLDGDI